MTRSIDYRRKPRARKDSFREIYCKIRRVLPALSLSLAIATKLEITEPSSKNDISCRIISRICCVYRPRGSRLNPPRRAHLYFYDNLPFTITMAISGRCRARGATFPQRDLGASSQLVNAS